MSDLKAVSIVATRGSNIEEYFGMEESRRRGLVGLSKNVNVSKTRTLESKTCDPYVSAWRLYVLYGVR